MAESIETAAAKKLAETSNMLRSPTGGGKPVPDPPKRGQQVTTAQAKQQEQGVVTSGTSQLDNKTPHSLSEVESSDAERSIGKQRTKKSNAHREISRLERESQRKTPEAEPAEYKTDRGTTQGDYASYITRDAVGMSQLAILEDLVTGKMSKTMTTRVTVRLLELVRAVDERENEIAFLRGRLQQLERANSTSGLSSTRFGSLPAARSYADVAGEHPIRNRIRQAVYPEKLLITGDVQIETSKEVKGRLENIIRPAGEQLRVRHLLLRRKGEVLLLLGDAKTKKSLKEAGLRVAEVRGRRPKIIFRGVNWALESDAVGENI